MLVLYERGDGDGATQEYLLRRRQKQQFAAKTDESYSPLGMSATVVRGSRLTMPR